MIAQIGCMDVTAVGMVKRVRLRQCAKFRGDRPKHCRDMEMFRFFKMAAVRHLGFVICVRTTYEGHLTVFIAVQNLVGIDAVVLIICMFFDFTSLA